MNEFLDFINKSYNHENWGGKNGIYHIYFERTDLRTIKKFSNKKYIKILKIDYNANVFRYKIIDEGVFIHAFDIL